MRDRIIQVMEKVGMSQAQFASTIGVQRAAFSHVISGRNNPSLDVMMKILNAFPSISPDWLLLGKGNIFRENIPESETLFPVEPPKIEVLRDDAPSPSSEEPSNETVQEKPETPPAIAVAKSVNKIMVFYSDNTYEIFVPEKQTAE